jgi:NAD-dependent SIR2 family protein deacetylase
MVTFNYDVALDYALHDAGMPVNYALSDVGPQERLALLKLHGSLNWARCIGCEKVVPWTLEKVLRALPWRRVSTVGARWETLEVGSQIAKFEHCKGKKVEPEPEIVPPTWNKAEHHKALSSVWARAAKELGEAESIFVIGYSLPPSDFFFRYLYALGSVGETTLRHFWVFNPDASGDVEKRFKKLLGPGARQRFRYFPETFSESIPRIARALR